MSSTRSQGRVDLAEQATKFGPDELRALADKLGLSSKPGAHLLPDDDRARRRGITIGRQDIRRDVEDHRLADSGGRRVGMRCRPSACWRCASADESPHRGRAPIQAIKHACAPAQRNHDALAAMCRSTLASGELGAITGPPVSIVVTTTLQELESAAGIAHTGRRPPAADARCDPDGQPRAARSAHLRHAHRPRAVSRETKRIATPAQADCVARQGPRQHGRGARRRAIRRRLHHVNEWAVHHRTDIDDLTFACGPCHKLLDDDGWTTRKNTDGVTEWIAARSGTSATPEPTATGPPNATSDSTTMATPVAADRSSFVLTARRFDLWCWRVAYHGGRRRFQ